MFINDVTGKIINSAMKVHTKLGPGLLESCYRDCLAYELKQEGLLIEVEKPIPLVYESVKLEAGFRADILVENCVIAELKSVEAIHDVHIAQIFTYMRLSNAKIGLLINFNVIHLKDGINRYIL
jgi:GxxExxY protein